jgi:general secretion pathway protein J
MSFNSRNNYGFTLLEVLIAISLLVVISLAIYQATTETYRLRDTLMNEGDFHNGIRLSMSVMERDVSQLYSPILMVPEKKGPPAPADAQDMEAILATDQGRTTDFWTAAVDKTGIRPSRFIGTEKKMSFISVSHIRMYKNTPESEFAKITYELQSDRNQDGKDTSTNVLVKTESPNAFLEEDYKDKMKHIYPLLHGVTKLHYRYYRKEKEEWLNSWDSDHPDFKNTYPDMVEISLEVKGPSKLRFEGIYKFRPEIPLRGLNPNT